MSTRVALMSLLMLSAALFMLAGCANSDRTPLEALPGGPNTDGGICLGGAHDGQACSDESGVLRCKEGGGQCAQAAGWTCKHNSTTGACTCTCSVLLPPSSCLVQLKKSCRLASNCDENACSETSCTWTGVSPGNCH
jgi:hypothetical protein